MQSFPPSLLILSPVRTRTSEPSSSVSGLNTTQLADGALVYCQENAAEYQLDRASAAVPDGITVIAPSAGPGRWLLFAGGSTGQELAFASPAAVAAFDASAVTPFATAGVGVVNDIYQYEATPSAAVLAAADGVNIIAPTAPAGAAWTRGFLRNLSAQYETAWWIDPSLGSDANAGTTALAPLKTLQELANRLRRATIAQDVLVSCAAGDIGGAVFEVSVASGKCLQVSGTVAVSSARALTSVVVAVPATNTREEITDAGGTFAVGQRLKLTSGTMTNGLATVLKLNGGVTDAFVSRWGFLSNPKTGFLPTLGSPAPGDTYVVETFQTTHGQLSVTNRGAGRVLFSAMISDSGSQAMRTQNDSGTTGGVAWYDSLFTGAASLWEAGQAAHLCCDATASVVMAALGSYATRNSVYRGGLQVNTGTLSVSRACSIAGAAGVALLNGAFGQFTGGGTGDCGFFDMTGASVIDIGPGCMLDIDQGGTQLWGTGNAATVAIKIRSGGELIYAVKPNIAGGGSDVNLSGTNMAYAAIPANDAVHQAGFVLRV